MKNFLSQNWFKSVIALGVIIISASTFYYFVLLRHQKETRIQEKAQTDLIEKKEKEARIQDQAQIDLIEKNKLDAQRVAKENLERQQKEKLDNFINKCITDAYTELKTLQANYDWSRNKQCSNNPDFCSSIFDYWNKAKDEALTTYKEEWVSQCKLGNRVFLDYELYKN